MNNRMKAKNYFFTYLLCVLCFITQAKLFAMEEDDNIALASKLKEKLTNAIKDDDVGKVENLIKMGAKVSSEDLIYTKSVPMCILLIRQGARLDYTDKDRKSLLQLIFSSNASTFNDENLIIFLVQSGININSQDKNGDTILMNIIESDEKDKFKWWKFIVKIGGSIHMKDNIGNTILHITLDRFDFNQCDDEIIELCNYLMDEGIDINTKNQLGETPLFTSISNCNILLCKYLFSRGAKIGYTKDINSFPSLSIAVQIFNYNGCSLLQKYNLIKTLIVHSIFNPVLTKTESNISNDTIIHALCSLKYSFPQLYKIKELRYVILMADKDLRKCFLHFPCGLHKYAPDNFLKVAYMTIPVIRYLIKMKIVNSELAINSLKNFHLNMIKPLMDEAYEVGLEKLDDRRLVDDLRNVLDSNLAEKNYGKLIEDAIRERLIN